MSAFDKEKWRAELKKIEHAIDDGTGGCFFGTEEGDALALLERAYNEGRASSRPATKCVNCGGCPVCGYFMEIHGGHKPNCAAARNGTP